jgi:hypothetical protein
MILTTLDGNEQIDYVLDFFHDINQGTLKIESEGNIKVDGKLFAKGRFALLKIEDLSD